MNLKLWLFRMAVAVFWTAAAPMVYAQFGTQTFTHDDFAQTGITRLSDLYELARGWTATSTEDFHWDVAPIGVGRTTDWKLFVDHAPVDLRALGRQSINLLPLNLSDICLVQFHSLPTVIGGIAALSGAIHLHTCDVQRGLAVHGVLGAGNETGDPGPWRYLPSAVPNVDRTGPTIQGSIAAANRRGHVRVQTKLDEHHATDPRIRTRVHTLYRGVKDARIQLRNAQVDLQWGQHTLAIATVRSQDFLFVDLLGLEAPVNHELTYARLSGSWAKFGRYHVMANRSRVLTRTNPGNVNLDFEQDVISAHLHSPHILDIENLDLGLQGTLIRTRIQRMQQTQSLILGRAYGHWTSQIAKHLETRFFGEFTLDGGIPGYTLIGTGTLDDPQLLLTLALTNRAYAGRHDFTYWLRQGYQPTTPGQPPLYLTEDRTREATVSADLAWHITRGITRITLTGGFRRHMGIQLMSIDAQFDPISTGLHTRGTMSAASGQVGRGAAEAELSLNSKLRTILHAAYAYPFSDQHLYRSAWHERLRVHVQADFTPNPRFTVHARVRYRGSSYWYDYEDAARDGSAHYAANLPSALFADLTVQKRLWGDHLNMSATLRNLIDHPHLSHPASGRTRLSFHVKLAYSFRAFTQSNESSTPD